MALPYSTSTNGKCHVETVLPDAMLFTCPVWVFKAQKGRVAQPI
jgi:hypothetical protein